MGLADRLLGITFASVSFLVDLRSPSILAFDPVVKLSNQRRRCKRSLGHAGVTSGLIESAENRIIRPLLASNQTLSRPTYIPSCQAAGSGDNLYDPSELRTGTTPPDYISMESETEIPDDDFFFYSLLYSSITVLFAMAVLSKFLTNEFRFGFRSFLSLVILFIGEPLCHFLLRGPQGVAIFGLGCLLVYSSLPASHLPAEGKAVFITGCDSGFGLALAKKLDAIGMTVFAGCLDKNSRGATSLQVSSSERLHVLELDVTNDKQLESAYDYVALHLGDHGLWGLVNNAGIWYVGDIEITPECIFRKVLDVNLFGMMRVTKRFLPLVKKSKGRIVNMSSLTGKVPFECLGPYCISKSAIETYSDCLRMEMQRWDVAVSVVQPAGYKTGAVDSACIQSRKEDLWEHMDERTKSEYGRRYLDKLYQNYESYTPKCPEDLTPVIRCMRSAVLSKKPLKRYIAGRGARTLLTVYPLMPIWLADKLSTGLGFGVYDIKPLSLED